MTLTVRMGKDQMYIYPIERPHNFLFVGNNNAFLISVIVFEIFTYELLNVLDSNL